MIDLHGIRKTIPKTQILLFDNMEFSLGEYRSVAITGRSGSGKTTLLKLLAGLDTVYDGVYTFENKIVSKSTSKNIEFRKKNIGLITQNYNLLEDRNVSANIQLTLGRKKNTQKVNKLLDLVGLSNYGLKKISEISGGEAQRVAIARALIKKPKVLLADEPTGALDEKTEQEILALLERIKQTGARLIMVTHSDAVAKICDAQFILENGKLLLVNN
ncbi:ABC transporter ATP-binding protein [Enterococcus sp. BWT-B8]|uniref:ABC transporter ATP-binding protein n=1 Tax=Enterococcus sp. BWT-B8 TaxID=2885157 RepID=UPI001E4DE1CE|nr:ABC transporter ATP-binding protein [Enterococcus sp. BWT-B8]MCB5952971.1 ABC transporter ATP-binding protein [Enterococcus sp. BWT-B8]